MHDHFAITIARQALLGAFIHNVHRNFPFMLWHILRGLANWHVWKARSTLVMEEIHIPMTMVKIKIWKDLRIYMQIHWATLYS